MRFLASLIALFAIAPIVAAAPTYTVVDLGDFGGAASYAMGINNSGQIAGYAYNAALGKNFAFLYDRGLVTSLGSFGGQNTVALSINGNGQITGFSGSEAYLYTAGQMRDLGRLAGTSYSEGESVNDSGVVVGDSENRAFAYDTNVMRALGTLPGATSGHSWAWGINGQGWIAGESDSGSGRRAFLIHNGTMTNLGVLGNGLVSQAVDVNDNDVVVGSSATYNQQGVNGGWTAFRYTLSGGLVGIGQLNSEDTYPSAINNAGVVVGTAGSPGGTAWIYRNGAIVDLNGLIDSNSGWRLQYATGINDSGQIVGYGVNGDGMTHAFLLDVPEPSATVAAWFVAVLACFRRKFQQSRGTNARFS